MRLTLEEHASEGTNQVRHQCSIEKDCRHLNLFSAMSAPIRTIAFALPSPGVAPNK